MNSNNKITGYFDRHPNVGIVLFILAFIMFYQWIQKDKEIESIKYYLTKTEEGDFFTSACKDYFNKNKKMESLKYDSQEICLDLTKVVNEANKNTIEVMYETGREDYENYRQSQN